MSKTRKANKMVSEKKVCKYNIAECVKVLEALKSKGQVNSVHFDNVSTRLLELTKKGC